MTELSPAAEAVLDAALPHQVHRYAAAAALRAAADRKCELEIPFSIIDEWEKITGSCASFYAAAEWGYKQALKDCKAIAAELEVNL